MFPDQHKKHNSASDNWTTLALKKQKFGKTSRKTEISEPTLCPDFLWQNSLIFSGIPDFPDSENPDLISVY